jgi:hypothetical protein
MADYALVDVLGNQGQLFVKDVALQSDGKIIVSCAVGTSTVRGFTGLIFRLNIDGTADRSFGVDGFIPHNYGGGPIAIDSQNRILVTGASYKLIGNGLNSTYDQGNLTVTRYLKDGSIDQSFGTNGIGNYAIGNTGQSNGIGFSINNNGQILVAFTITYKSAVHVKLASATLDL